MTSPVSLANLLHLDLTELAPANAGVDCVSVGVSGIKSVNCIVLARQARTLRQVLHSCSCLKQYKNASMQTRDRWCTCVEISSSAMTIGRNQCVLTSVLKIALQHCIAVDLRMDCACTHLYMYSNKNAIQVCISSSTWCVRFEDKFAKLSNSPRSHGHMHISLICLWSRLSTLTPRKLSTVTSAIRNPLGFANFSRKWHTLQVL